MPHITPMAVDISHHNTVTSFAAMKSAGFVGVIHKASQGSQYQDPTYRSRRVSATAAGLLWGAYHFNNGDDVTDQIDDFFGSAQPDSQTLMALDFEDNRASNMSLAQAVDFLKRGDDRLGRKLWIYSGNRMKEQIVKADDATRAFLAQHPLWCCQYGPVLRLKDANGRPLPWPRASLWQFTGDGVGPKPHTVPGVSGVGIDINSYDGTREQLKAEWLGAAALVTEVPTA